MKYVFTKYLVLLLFTKYRIILNAMIFFISSSLKRFRRGIIDTQDKIQFIIELQISKKMIETSQIKKKICFKIKLIIHFEFYFRKIYNI